MSAWKRIPITTNTVFHEGARPVAPRLVGGLAFEFAPVLSARGQVCINARLMVQVEGYGSIYLALGQSFKIFATTFRG